jgi:hypothetical protein
VPTEEAFDFEKCFGVPADHTLRRSDLPPVAGARLTLKRWEHEEYDKDNNLVAVYESWKRDDDRLAFVKYSPFGWVLSVSGQSPRFPPPKTRVRLRTAA